MRFFNVLILVFYTMLILLLGALFISISVGIISMDNIVELFSLFYGDASLKLSLGISGLLFIIIGLGVLQLASNKVQREKTIAFENPNGQIAISLVAIEDFIKRLFHADADIKELKPVCLAGRKGIEISSKVSLWQDAKVPEATERIQSTIKAKLKQLLGIEEAITVKVHVVKIASKEMRRLQGKKAEESEIEAPYRYRD